MSCPTFHAPTRLPLLAAVCCLLPLGAEAKVDFNREVRPILSDKCFACHGFDEKERKGGLRLDVRESALQPAKSGEAAIVPNRVDASELVRRITAADEEEHMPPAKTGKTLAPAEVETLKQWIAEGAEYQSHWSFVAPAAPAMPGIVSGGWPRNGIDHFILARLEADQSSPSPEAGRETLIRRLTLDLTGLPPTLAEIDAFLADGSAGAYERVVDRLLTSPRYGERMAVDWLDAARFADTHGFHLDSGRDMTPWRDWVIRAFNENKPYDQFTVEQLAGDILAAQGQVDDERALDLKIASGFNRNHMINYEGGAIAEEYLHAYLVDRVNTTTTVWLGLTYSCAQCHDHKYDPITQKEFYQLYAFFNGVPESGLDGHAGNAKPFLPVPTAAEKQRLAELDDAIKRAETRLKSEEENLPPLQAAWEKQWREQPPADPSDAEKAILAVLAMPAEALNDDQRRQLSAYYRDHLAPESFRTAGQALQAVRQERDALNKSIRTTMVMSELETPRDTFVHVRGLYDQRGERVEPGVPASLPPLAAGGKVDRLALARWLVAPGHPLTARVTVNRFWQQYFGTGLVKTAEDFGSQGEWPSHPELLDWLATEFVRTGWDVKALQKLIVMSATYRQSSRMTPETFERDPENRLLARGPRFRLKAEFIRDQALALAGLLGTSIGGKSVNPYQPGDLWGELSQRSDSANFTAQFFVQGRGDDLYRRSMYTFWKRSSPPPQMSTLDAPDREVCTVRRPRTNTPLQALVLMNDPTYIEASRKFAERLLLASPDEEERFALAFRTATGRPASDRELAVLRRVFTEQLARYRADAGSALALVKVGDAPYDTRFDLPQLAAWTMVASTLLNLDETITKG
jgi:hypothetical protein